MKNPSYVALSRLTVINQALQVVANNVANMNTTAFRADRMLFAEHLARPQAPVGATRDRISFVEHRATVLDLTPGAITSTGNPLDLAIEGEGWLVVETDAGERYTRDGRLKLDDTGQLVTSNGNPILGQGGQPIVFAQDDGHIEIAADGTISTENGQIGQLQLVAFDSPYALEKAAGGLFSSRTPPIAAEEATIRQGAQEDANVQPISQITELVSLQRAFVSTSRMIDQENDRQLRAIRSLVRQA
ncbi:MAG: flagellar basal-body rod protein FlgF [Alphaproteobacteria bacterium]